MFNQDEGQAGATSEGQNTTEGGEGAGETGAAAETGAGNTGEGTGSEAAA